MRTIFILIFKIIISYVSHTHRHSALNHIVRDNLGYQLISEVAEDFIAQYYVCACVHTTHTLLCIIYSQNTQYCASLELRLISFYYALNHIAENKILFNPKKSGFKN